MTKETKPQLSIDYAVLMDLRIDYAFKLTFSKGDPRFLISLLNGCITKCVVDKKERKCVNQSK